MIESKLAGAMKGKLRITFVIRRKTEHGRQILKWSRGREFPPGAKGGRLKRSAPITYQALTSIFPSANASIREFHSTYPAPFKGRD